MPKPRGEDDIEEPRRAYVIHEDRHAAEDQPEHHQHDARSDGPPHRKHQPEAFTAGRLRFDDAGIVEIAIGVFRRDVLGDQAAIDDEIGVARRRFEDGHFKGGRIIEARRFGRSPEPPNRLAVRIRLVGRTAFVRNLKQQGNRRLLGIALRQLARDDLLVLPHDVFRRAAFLAAGGGYYMHAIERQAKAFLRLDLLGNANNARELSADYPRHGGHLED